LEDCNRIAIRYYFKDLYMIMQGPSRGFRQDLYKIFPHGIVTDLAQDLHTRTPIRESRKSVTKGPAAAGEDLTRTNLIQEPPKSIQEELSCKHL